MSTETKTKKVHFTTFIPETLAEEIRDAAFHIPGATVSGLVGEALKTYLSTLHSRTPIPHRPRIVRRGRPVERP